MRPVLQKGEGKLAWWQMPLLFLCSPLILVLVVLAIAVFVVRSVVLHILIWTLWRMRGHDILFIYSDSPIWHDYTEQHLLPRIRDRAVILNWSQRNQWRLSLARVAFSHFGRDSEFNPMAVVFRPFRSTQKFRFWQPFRDWKHGHPATLEKMENDFFALIRTQ